MRQYHGIKKAVSSVNTWPIAYGGHTQIGYEPAEDCIVYAEFPSDNNWCIWTPGIINIGNYRGHITMDQLKQDIDAVLANIDR